MKKLLTTLTLAVAIASTSVGMAACVKQGQTELTAAKIASASVVEAPVDAVTEPSNDAPCDTHWEVHTRAGDYVAEDTVNLDPDLEMYAFTDSKTHLMVYISKSTPTTITEVKNAQ